MLEKLWAIPRFKHHLSTALNSQKGNKFECIAKANAVIIVSASPFQKKNPRRSSHLRPVEAEWKAYQSHSFIVASCPPWPAQSRTRKGTGKRKNTRRLSSVVNHREPLCLQLPLSEELCRAETMALLWSCISSTSSAASDE